MEGMIYLEVHLLRDKEKVEVKSIFLGYNNLMKLPHKPSVDGLNNEFNKFFNSLRENAPTRSARGEGGIRVNDGGQVDNSPGNGGSAG